jgi:hypothetical protein
MSYKLFIARCNANRIAKRNRAQRRNLRDHLRQELGQLRRDEKRVRGLRLYVAWSQPGRRHSAVEIPELGWSHAAQPAI